MSTDERKTHEGACFCGTVRVKATGAPFAMGFCHCDDCRAWSAAPVNGFTLWKRSDVSVTAGAENLATFKKTERSHRQFCTNCGGHVMTDHPGADFVDVYAAILPTLNFEPALHVHCKHSVVAIKDDMPKFADLPSEFGGSGALIGD
jgi:hypothetical protein